MFEAMVTSGEAAKELGVSVALIQKLERLGVIPPARRVNRFRVYNETDLEHLRQVIADRRARQSPQPEAA
jgi:DNA-binding transcriptional MerR regulator